MPRVHFKMSLIDSGCVRDDSESFAEAPRYSATDLPECSYGDYLDNLEVPESNDGIVLCPMCSSETIVPGEEFETLDCDNAACQWTFTKVT